MVVPQLIKRLSISLCLTCIGTSIFASPAKISTVKEPMQIKHIDALLSASLNELQPYYDKQAEHIIANLTGVSTLHGEYAQAAKHLSQFMQDSANQLIHQPQTQHAIQTIYSNHYRNDSALNSVQHIADKNLKIMNELTEYMMHFSQSMFNDAQLRNQLHEKIKTLVAPLQA